MIITTNLHANDCKLTVKVRTQTGEYYGTLHVLKLESNDGSGSTLFATREQLAEIAAAITAYLESTPEDEAAVQSREDTKDDASGSQGGQDERDV